MIAGEIASRINLILIIATAFYRIALSILGLNYRIVVAFAGIPTA